MTGDRVSGVPADQLSRTFGDLYFTFRYDINQIFARLVSMPEIEQKILRIGQASALPAPSGGPR
jgi:hypothetical protein